MPDLGREYLQSLHKGEGMASMSDPMIICRIENHEPVVYVDDGHGRRRLLAEVHKAFPIGFRWGDGSGCVTNLSRSILEHWFGEEVASERTRQFKRQFILYMEPEGGMFRRSTVARWLRSQQNLEVIREVCPSLED